MHHKKRQARLELRKRNKCANPKKKMAKKINFKRKFCNKLSTTLVNHLGMKKAMADFLATVTCGIIRFTHVWQKRIVGECKGSTVKNKTKKLQRFYADYHLNYLAFSRMLFSLLCIVGKVVIIIDRTTWDYGKKHINILVAAVRFKMPGGSQSFAIPIAWEVFDKNGNSNTAERKALMDRVFEIVGKENIEAILGDREFIGVDWLHFLHTNHVPFVIRIRKNMFVEHDGKLVKVGKLCECAQRGIKTIFRVRLNNLDVRLEATLSRYGELVLVIASLCSSFDLLDEYRQRWLIELFFKSIKTHGFNLEATHMTDKNHIKKLFALIALATLFVVKLGALKDHCIKKIKLKNHGRPTFSLFTYGLDFLNELFDSFYAGPLRPILRLLSPHTISNLALEKG